jgi:RimJ/RimL family protein N-acetyltransferase
MESGHTVLSTPRLVLRAWRAADLRPFAALNADPEVMRHFPACLSQAASERLAERIAAGIAARGFGLWALEVPGVAAFIGFLGLSVPAFAPPFESAAAPCVEIGWRIARRHWGQGYASEAGRAVLGHAFETLMLPEVVAFTVPANVRSLAVMRRLGMRASPDDDFLHPLLPAGHPLAPHVLYRLTAAEWRARPGARGCAGT